MSDTPRTNAERFGVTPDDYQLEVVKADFARQLERELNDARKALETCEAVRLQETRRANRLAAAGEVIWNDLRNRTHADFMMRAASFVRGEVCSIVAYNELRDALDGKPPAPEVADITQSPYKAAE